MTEKAHPRPLHTPEFKFEQARQRPMVVGPRKIEYPVANDSDFEVWLSSEQRGVLLYT